MFANLKENSGVNETTQAESFFTEVVNLYLGYTSSDFSLLVGMPFGWMLLRRERKSICMENSHLK